MMNVQTQVDRTDAQAASKDLQAVATSVALNYSLDPKWVAWVYKNIGDDFKNRIIDPAVQEAVKAVTARYNAENLISERDIVKGELIREITMRLEQSHILVTAVSLTNFAFSADFTKAVEDKVVATQQALKAQNDLATRKFEADQTVVTATAAAEAIRIQAQAIQSQGGAAYVQLQAIQQWDGKLPVNMYGSAPVPFININK
jgi:prohibitin 2